MRNVLDHTKPIQRYFEEISRIPRETEHEKEISDYVIRFAKEHELDWNRDALWNVIVKKPASEGYEKARPLILQAHMDMVCARTLDSRHDFRKDPIELVLKDHILRAKDTSLGADDGFGVAYMLAVLEDNTLKHPALECIFTTQEEHKTMVGAEYFDVSVLQGKRMIGLDGDGETVTFTASACSDLVIASKPLKFEPASGSVISFDIQKVTGNVISGVIHQECGNAIKMAVRMLEGVSHAQCSFFLCQLEGGTGENRSPQNCHVVLMCDPKDEETIKNIILQGFRKMKNEFLKGDFQAELEFQDVQVPEKMIPEKETQEILHFVYLLPNNLFQADVRNKELVSVNTMGISGISEESFQVTMSARSLMESPEQEFLRHMYLLCEAYGFRYETSVRYRSWEYNPDSELRRIANQIYMENCGQELREVTCPGGLEPSWFYSKIPNLDIIMLGPIHDNMHTVDEFLDMDSFERVYGYLLQMMERMTD